MSHCMVRRDQGAVGLICIAQGVSLGSGVMMIHNRCSINASRMNAQMNKWMK